ncbi:hypothetical protein [Serratia proteamaculans]|uniref:hypothetical protein n=1 Tax=Serratia proteamaculans TaxID=28151 RepID=UPI0020163076|nr:hypothetical protein [Serratia proteamaculans]
MADSHSLDEKTPVGVPPSKITWHGMLQVYSSQAMLCRSGRLDFCSLRLSLFCVPIGRLALPTTHGHIIILDAGSTCAQPFITVSKFIYLKLIFQVAHHNFTAVMMTG